jgi:hypothetical protein
MYWSIIFSSSRQQVYSLVLHHQERKKIHHHRLSQNTVLHMLWPHPQGSLFVRAISQALAWLFDYGPTWVRGRYGCIFWSAILPRVHGDDDWWQRGSGHDTTEIGDRRTKRDPESIGLCISYRRVYQICIRSVYLSQCREDGLLILFQLRSLWIWLAYLISSLQRMDTRQLTRVPYELPLNDSDD